jgi:hypothetical protein
MSIPMFAMLCELNIPHLSRWRTDLSLERLGKVLALQSGHDKFCPNWRSFGSFGASPSEISSMVSLGMVRRGTAPGWACWASRMFFGSCQYWRAAPPANGRTTCGVLVGEGRSVAVFMWLDCGSKQAFLPLFLNQNEWQGAVFVHSWDGVLFIRKVSIDTFAIRFLINIVYSWKAWVGRFRQPSCWCRRRPRMLYANSIRSSSTEEPKHRTPDQAHIHNVTYPKPQPAVAPPKLPKKVAKTAQ